MTTFLRRFYPLFIVIGIVVGFGAYVRSCNRLMEARNATLQEVRKYADGTNTRASYIAKQLARPYLDAYTLGKYDQRLRTLGNKPLVFGFYIPDDSYASFLSGLQFELIGVMHQMDKSDPKFAALSAAEENINELNMLNLHLMMFERRLTCDQEPGNMKELEAYRREFEDLKKTDDTVLAKYSP